MKDLAGFYRGKKVLVTGHTGFKGAWLSLWLTEIGAEVMGYALEPNTDPSLFQVLKLDRNTRHVIGDIRDHNHLLDAVSIFKPEIVFHLAAQPIVRLSYQQPLSTFATNVMGTVHLLETIRQLDSVRAVVNVTSDKCYENTNQLWSYRESDPMGGYDPYSASKGCSELVTSAYRRSFFQHTTIALASARAGNVIGGGDWAADRLIPDIVRSLSEGREIVIRHPYATRPWQHVLEALSGYLLLGFRLYEEGQSFAQAWNFGPRDNEALAVEMIVKKAIDIWGSGQYKVENRDQPYEATQLKLDMTKAAVLLNWQPRLSVEEALTCTLQWYAAFYRGDQIHELTLRQLRWYKSKGA